MERVENESSRGPLGAFRPMLAGSGQALFGQAQSLAGDVQRRIARVMPPVLNGELEATAVVRARLEDTIARVERIERHLVDLEDRTSGAASR